MAGILNPKQRVMDVVITEVGREQMRKGQFEVVYASFSDRMVEYKKDEDNVLNLFEGIAFEAFTEDSDEIVPEIDNEGLFTLTKGIAPNLQVNNDGTLIETDFGSLTEPVDPYTYMNEYTLLSKSRLDKLKILQTEKTVDDFDDSDVLITTNSVIEPGVSPSDLNYFIEDPRMTTQLSLKRLPPVSLIQGEHVPLNVYSELLKPKTIHELVTSVKTDPSLQYATQTYLGPNEAEYDILGQIFMKKASEDNDKVIRKLVILNAGDIKDEFGTVKSRLLYCGLVFKENYTDEDGNVFGGTKFSNTCTLILSKE